MLREADHASKLEGEEDLGLVFLVYKGRGELMPSGCICEFMDFKRKYVRNAASCRRKILCNCAGLHCHLKLCSLSSVRASLSVWDLFSFI